MMGTTDIDDEAGLSSPKRSRSQEPPQVYEDSLSSFKLSPTETISE
jgi:hypothetical protein